MRLTAALWTALCLSLSLLCQTLNPVPVINQPLNPASTTPGSGGFTLTLNGSGFVPGAVVNWNGVPRPATFISSSQLTAAVAATDVAAAVTVAISVSNPSPGGGTSNTVFLPITSPTTSVSLARSDLATGSAPFSIAVGDFQGSGKLSLATTNSGADSISVLLGNGDGSFAAAVNYPTGSSPASIVAGDFNNDGILDLAVANSADGTVSVLLGTGNGSFGAKTDFTVGSAPIGLAAADLNGDGNLDLVVANSGSASLSVLLGKGDGTFAAAVNYGTGNTPQSIAVSDFNGDGKLDVAVADNADNLVSVLLGNGDGTFQPKVDYAAASPYSLTVADLNGDGFADLAAASSASNEVSVLLGKGDGTFAAAVTYPTPGAAHSVVVGDLNGDGKLDFAVTDFDTLQISILLGNGDGTFQSHLDYSTPSSAETVAIGDFNGDGRLDVAAANYAGSAVSVFLQEPLVSLSSTSLSFSSQSVGTTSAAQSTILNNAGSASLSISAISVTGQNSGDFAQTNTCIPSGSATGALPGGAHCTITVSFTPSAQGTRTAAISINDSAAGSPQTVSLTGTSVAPSVSLSPNSVTFPSQVVGTPSTPQPVILTNTGTGALTVTAVSASAGFTTTTNCAAASPLQPGTSCTESVAFTPPSAGVTSGALTFTDNDSGIAGSTQSVSLSGTGIKGNTTTTIGSVTPSPSVVGQAVTITFTVSPPSGDPLNPSGSVTVTASSGESCSGTAPSGSCSLVLNTVGSRTLTAAYSGDNNFNGSSSAAAAQSVSKASTSTALTSSATPSLIGQTVTFTANVLGQFGGTLTGSVVFKQNSTVLGTVPLSSGVATLGTSTLPVGSSTITAIYSGDPNFLGSSASLIQKVNKITTSTTVISLANPSVVAQSVTFTATVGSAFGPPPDGELVTFKQGTTILGTAALSGGSVSLNTSFLGAGSFTVTASYAGDSKFLSSSASVKETVNRISTTTALTSSINPSVTGQAVTFTATVSSGFGSPPDGELLTFKQGTITLGAVPLSGGSASYSTSSLASGSSTITASYPGDSKFAPGSGSLTQTVAKPCPINGWCQVYLQGSGMAPGKPAFAYNGWSQPTFDSDTGFTYLPSQANQTTDGTFCNPTNPTLPCSGQPNLSSLGGPSTSDLFFTQTQTGTGGIPAAYTAPPWDEFSSTGAVLNATVLVGSGAGAGYLAPNGMLKNALWLRTSIGPTDTAIVVCATSSCNSNGGVARLNASGYLALDDEVIYWGACSAVDSTGAPVSCGSTSAVIFTLTNCLRGLRTNAGWTAATAHTANLSAKGWSYGRAWLASPKVTSPNAVQFGARINTNGLQGGKWNNLVNGRLSFNFLYGTSDISPTGAFDAPPDRHPVGDLVADTNRGKLWRASGWGESTAFEDTWWICVAKPIIPITGNANPAFNSCIDSDLLNPTWHHVNLSGNPANPCPGGLSSCGPGIDDENALAFDPADDLIYECCGLMGGATDSAWVFCLSATDNGVPACHANLTGAYVQGAWMPVCGKLTATQCQGNPPLAPSTTCVVISGQSTCHGRAGVRDAPRIVWDPVDQSMLIVGGRTALQTCSTTNPCWTSIAQWNPKTNDICLSEITQSTSTFREFNGKTCTLGPVQGPVPVMNGSLYYPDVAWEADQGVLVLYKWDEASSTTSGVYVYKPAANTWVHLTSIPGGPPSGTAAVDSGKGMVYDTVNHMLMAVQGDIATANLMNIWELSDSSIASALLTSSGP